MDLNLGRARELKSAFLNSFATEGRTSVMAYQLAISIAPVVIPWEGVALGLTGKTRNDVRFALRATSELVLDSPAVSEFLHVNKDQVDVEITGEIQALPCGVNVARVRPPQTGFSVGHHRVTAGTIGEFVSRPGMRTLILSNNHVLADTNRGQRGDPVLQPGTHDGGVASDQIGTLVDSVALNPLQPNLVDAAIAEVDEGIELEHVTSALGVLGSDVVDDGLEVTKHGRTTGFTEGVVTAVEVDGLRVNYGTGGVFVFDSQIEIGRPDGSAFSAGGDSGSLVVTKSEPRVAVGLLFAGGVQPGRPHRTYASPIDVVLDTLGIALM